MLFRLTVNLSTLLGRREDVEDFNKGYAIFSDPRSRSRLYQRLPSTCRALDLRYAFWKCRPASSILLREDRPSIRCSMKVIDDPRLLYPEGGLFGPAWVISLRREPMAGARVDAGLLGAGV